MTFSETCVSHAETHSLIRLIDAAANRAREGLRIVEDYVRFVLDDRHLTSLCKQLRHDLTSSLTAVPLQERLAARDTLSDVGTELSTAAETQRSDLAAVLTANLTRLQEALRSLEEFGKLRDVAFAESIKQIRYRTYTIQRAIETTGTALERLAGRSLYVLIDGQGTLAEFESLAQALIGADVSILQLRDKHLDDRRLLHRARLLRRWTLGTGTLFIMNDRPDLAVLSHADGVHVGQTELSVKDARTILGTKGIVGVSAHSIEQARQAVLDGANYIGVGPTFPSSTKSFEKFPGLNLLHAVAEEIRLPAYAIGGITDGNLHQVLATGFSRVAVGASITAAQAPGEAATQMLAAIKACK